MIRPGDATRAREFLRGSRGYLRDGNILDDDAATLAEIIAEIRSDERRRMAEEIGDAAKLFFGRMT